MTVKFIRKGYREGPDGDHPVLALYTHNSRAQLIGTGLKVKKVRWDFDKGEATGWKGAKAYNRHLDSIRDEILEVANNIRRTGVEPYGKQVLEAIKQGKETDRPEHALSQSLVVSWAQYLESKKSGLQQRTIWSYQNSLDAMEEFLKEKGIRNILIEKFTLKHADQWKDFLRKKNSPNTVSKRLKHLRMFLAREKKNGAKIALDLTDVKQPEAPGAKISVTQDELQALIDVKLVGTLPKIRDLMALQIYTGLRVSDLMRVNDNLTAKKISITTKKTGSLVEIPISPAIREILERYKYRLPKFSDQYYNDKIKEVFEKACPTSVVQVRLGRAFESKFKFSLITSHDLVRSFITLASEKGMSVPSIARLTGKTVNVLLKHYLNDSQKVAEAEFEKAWGVSPLKIAR